MATIRRLPVGDFAFALLPKSAEKIAEMTAEMAAVTGAAASANSVGSTVEIAEAAWEDAIDLDTVRRSSTSYSYSLIQAEFHISRRDYTSAIYSLIKSQLFNYLIR